VPGVGSTAAEPVRPAGSEPRRPCIIAAGVLVLAAALSGCSSSPTTSSDSPTPTTAAPPVTLPDDRRIDVHVPATYDPETPAPLLLLLHGYGASGEIQDSYLGLADVADDAGMLYVHPDGTENSIGKQFWNATDACCAGPRSDVDDSAYLADVIAKVSQDYNVDPDRVFIIGHSNGGFMAFRMACDHADEIAAIVSWEAATFADPDDCAPTEPVSTLQVHGESDTTILYGGGEIAGRRYPSAPDTLAMWVAANGCDPEPDDPPPADRQIVSGLPAATVTAHTDCNGGVTSELWTQPEGTHIPARTDDFSAQLVAWLQEHPKAQ